MSVLVDLSFEDQKIRAYVYEMYEAWFAADIARVLGYRKTDDMTKLISSSEGGTLLVQTDFGEQKIAVIGTFGIFSVINRRQEPEIKRFKTWVMSMLISMHRRIEGSPA